MVSIHLRPPEVNDRVMPGRWEGDLIKGAGNMSAIGVLVERTSRLVLLARMQDSTAATALAAFKAKLQSIAAAPLSKQPELLRPDPCPWRLGAEAATTRLAFCQPGQGH